MEVTSLVIREIKEHGARAYPFEACGFVLGHFKNSGLVRGEKTLEAINSRQGEKRRRRFNIEAEEFLAAERAAQSQGLDILAIYHSHPDHPALPSANDLEKALPFYRYLIVKVENGQAKELSCWLLANDRSGFLKQELTILP
ncbi:MAG: M67 family metallopeptidase [Deltaproteobacteria bacterium]|jgi:proteasome lid subunit RPN8/RPN11|nr:M67 family metallopeptidase [Deltaproteobacteria bacterium]